MFLIGVAGGSGSGKTTFAKKVIKNLDSDSADLLHMDSYYLPVQPETNLSPLGKANFDHPSAFDWELLRFHLKTLKNGGKVNCPVYDFNNHCRSDETRKVGPSKVILFEGIFALFDKQIRELLDIKAFLHVDSDIRFTRRLHRDVKERGRSLESVIAQYYDTVRPMYEKFLSPQRQYADFIVGEETDVAADILGAKAKELVKSESDSYEFNVHTNLNHRFESRESTTL